jgi:gluconate 5-dehydrogenase
MNQVETWFGVLTRQAIRRGSFGSVKELIARIDTFTAHWNAGSWILDAPLRRPRPACRDSGGNVMHGTSLFSLDGKTALITGSSRGIGLGIARGLGQAGAKVILNGRTDRTLRAAASKLDEDGIRVLCARFDVRRPAEVEASVDHLETTVGAIDILVNNAGIALRRPLVDTTLRQWRAVLETNLTSSFVVGTVVARRMLGRSQGKIVNVCSLQSEAVRPGLGAYAAAKGGLKMLTRAMCAEWGPHGIQVNAIGPGYIETPLTESLRADAEFDAWIRRRVPAGRWGMPEDLVGTAIYLASSASDYVNGQIVYVDGGLLAVL